jgi:hypothetical protein
MNHRFPFTGEIVKVMVDVSEATFEELASSTSSARGSRWRRSEPRRSHDGCVAASVATQQ